MLIIVKLIFSKLDILGAVLQFGAICAVAALSVSALRAKKVKQTEQPIIFARTYTSGRVFNYSVQNSAAGLDLILQIEETVISAANSTSSNMRFRVAKADVVSGPAMDQALPTVESICDVRGLPQKIKFSGMEGFIDNLCLAGMTSGGPIKSGEDFNVHWTNGTNMTVDATGHLQDLDLRSKMLTVKWVQKWTFSSGSAWDVALTSIYDTSDMSLVSSEGDIKINLKPLFHLTVRRTDKLEFNWSQAV